MAFTKKTNKNIPNQSIEIPTVDTAAVTAEILPEPETVDEAPDLKNTVHNSEQPPDEDVEVQESTDMAMKISQDTDMDPIIKIPLCDVKKLLTANNVIPVPVHDIIINVNLDEFEKLSDANPHALSTVNALSAALARELTPEDVVKIRNQQIFSYTTGCSVMEDVGVVMEASALEIQVPTLRMNLKIEDVSTEGFMYDEALPMVHIKPEARELSKGMEKVLKKTTVVNILNRIQDEGEEKEFLFYMNLLGRMPESNTFKLALAQLRLNMQYLLNCDTLELQVVMTDLVMNQEA